MPAVSVTREQALAATGCTKLSEALVARSPFPSVDALVDTMNSIWSGGGGGGGGVGGKFRNSFNPLSDVVVGVPDWLEAFASHPRIGSKSDLEKASAKEQREASAQNKRGAVPRSTSASASAASTLSTLPTLSHAASSAREQAGASSAGAETRAALAEWNELYQQKFGHIYIVCASGRSGEDMLEDLKRRFLNPPHEEIAIAAAEHIKIAEKRLRGLFEGEGRSPAPPPPAAAASTEEEQEERERRQRTEEQNEKRKAKKFRFFSCFKKSC